MNYTKAIRSIHHQSTHRYSVTKKHRCKRNQLLEKDYTSTDSSGGSELSARSNKALMFLSSFKRDKKSAYLQHIIGARVKNWFSHESTDQK